MTIRPLNLDFGTLSSQVPTNSGRWSTLPPQIFNPTRNRSNSTREKLSKKKTKTIIWFLHHHQTTTITRLSLSLSPQPPLLTPQFVLQSMRTVLPLILWILPPSTWSHDDLLLKTFDSYEAWIWFGFLPKFDTDEPGRSKSRCSRQFHNRKWKLKQLL